MKQDPIFALIEAHRAAHATWTAVVDGYTPIEQKLGALGLKPSQEPRHPLMVAYNKRYTAAHRVMDRAETKLCKTKPTTLAGISALTLYMIEIWNTGNRAKILVEAPEGNCLENLLRTLAAAADGIASKQPASNVMAFKKAA